MKQEYIQTHFREKNTKFVFGKIGDSDELNKIQNVYHYQII